MLLGLAWPAAAQARSPNGLIAGRCIYTICTMKPDGSNLKKVRTGYEPDWSPDGRLIAFVWGDDGRDGELATMWADGSHLTRLTRNRKDDRFPSWSPDGKRLVYSCGRQICTVRADGSARRSVTTGPGWAEDPDWAPFGNRIAFEAGVPDVDGYNIYVARPDGSGRTQITTGGSDKQASWSPSGQLLAFIGHGELRTVKPDGSNLHRLTRDQSGEDSAPVWAPDGESIAYAHSPSNDTASEYRVWIVDRAGTNIHRVSNQSSPYVGQLSWQRV